MIGHRLMGTSLLLTGDIMDGRAHFDHGIALCDHKEDRPLATRFGQAIWVYILSDQSLALWLLGYPEAAIAATKRVLKDAREFGQVATLMYALDQSSLTLILCGNDATATTQFKELVALTEEKGVLFWKGYAMAGQGCVLALTGNAPNAVHMITSGITVFRSTGATYRWPSDLAHLARAHAELGQFDLALRWRSDDGGGNNQGKVV